MQIVGSSMTVPVALSVFGAILISISGWLGGEMVYKHRLGVDEPRHEPRAGDEAPRRVA
jgi:uncharacterized membrane protein